MKRLWPVVKLTFRLPFRGSGWLMLLCGAGVAAFTFAISRSDGILVNEIAIRARYSLYFALTVLSLALLWYACLSMRGDIDVKRLHLLTSYPLPRWQIYVGKWVGLLGFGCLCLVSILATVAVCIGILVWRCGDPAQVRAFRDHYRRIQGAVHPAPPAVDRLVDQRLAELRESGELARDADLTTVRQSVRRQIVAETQRVGRNATKTWRFDAGRIAHNAETVTLRFHFYARDAQRPVFGRWLVEAADHPARYRAQANVLPDEDYNLTFPIDVIPADGRFTVSYTGVDNPDIVFPHDDGLVLLYDDGSWVRNVARLVPLLVAHLAAVVAVGLTISVAFTMSVASFVALVVYLLAVAGPFFAGILDEFMRGVGEEGKLLNTIGETVIPVGLFFTTGLERPDVVGPASAALAIGTNNIGMPVTRLAGATLLYPVRLVSENAFLWLQGQGLDLLLGFLCYVLVAAGLGIWLLNRKELDRVH